ncbi:MAG: DUF4214 domain-containing protein, partial [Clostridia bacterium]|nr:DUF4214 domain-containing protein [Clostridia bacterium]
MKSQSLDVEEADSDFFSMMREDIDAEAERIKDIPLPAERPVVKAVEKQSSTLSMEELMALDDVGFIENAYRKLLHRQIDVDGAYQYLARLRSGKMSKEQLIYILRTSEEGKRCGESIEDFYLKQPRFEWFSAFEGREFVENLYTWLLGRPADEAGLSDLERQLENGVSKQAIFAAVLNSPERTGKESDPATSPETETDDKPEIVDYDALLMLDDAEFVENVYRQILGREADSAGASHWLRACRMGEKTKDDMIFELRMSGEGVRKGVFISGARCDEAQLEKLTALKGTDFITNMFMWVLGRSVDETGMRNYRDMMKKGVSKHAILKNIAGSQEALKRKEKYEALKADAVAAPVNPEGDYGGSSLRSAESAVRDAVSKRQMEEAISKMQERWGSQTDMLYQHTALDALRISLLQRQLQGIADSLNGFQQQIDQMRRQATDQVASIRDEMAQKLDGISKSVFPKIEEMKAGFVLELESVRTELDEQTEARLAELHAELGEQTEAKLAELRAELGEQTDAKLAAIRDELGEQTDAKLAAIRDELGEQTEGKLAEIRTELDGQTEGKLAEIRTELDGQTDAKLAELRTALDGQVEARLNEAAKSAQDA